MSCETWSTLRAFATGELDAAAAERVSGHLESCAPCRQTADGVDPAWAALRHAYRPRAVSELLRSRVRWATRLPARADGPPRPTLAWGATAALAAGLLVWLGVGLTAWRREAPPPPTLERIAVTAHDAYLTGAAPLDLRTLDPAEVAAEFSRRLGLDLQLPAMTGAGLTLLGARVIQAGAALAAMLVYQQGDEVVSLTVAPRGAVALARGEAVERFRGVEFHFSQLDGRHLVQWTEGALSYVLVSSAPGSTRASCRICHAPGSGLSDVDEFHRAQ